MPGIFSPFSRGSATPEVQSLVPPPTVDGKTKSTDPPAFSRGLRIGKMEGGAGGQGGNANDRVTGGTCELGLGGRGGQGGEALINHHDENSCMTIDEFKGGSGGGGGGGAIAGDGGDGGRAIIKGDEQTLLSKYRLPGSDMTINEFGAKFSLSENTVNKLSDSGYDTAGSLRFATVIDLKEDGFKQGHINQLKHALDVWSPRA